MLHLRFIDLRLFQSLGNQAPRLEDLSIVAKLTQLLGQIRIVVHDDRLTEFISARMQEVRVDFNHLRFFFVHFVLLDLIRLLQSF